MSDRAELVRPPRLGSRSVRVELGLFAFTPALALLAYRSRPDLIWVCFAAPAALGCVIALGAALVVRQANPEPFELASIEDAGNEILGHVGSYLLPVVVVTQSREAIVIAGISLALIIQIHIATGRVHVNPLLYLAGLRTYRARAADGTAYYLIARTDPATWPTTTLCKQLGSALLVESSTARH